MANGKDGKLYLKKSHNMQEEIKYLKHSQINKEKWDNCIAKSVNRQVYAFSWYLDVVAPDWDALVREDYTAVMPLPVRSKLGIKYAFVPLFTQQLGVFYTVQEPNTDDFINAIPSSFKYIQLKLNKDNKLKTIPYTENTNQILILDKTYEATRKKFHRNCIRNIKNAVEAGFIFSDKYAVDDFMVFFKNHLNEQLSLITKDDFAKLKELISKMIELKHGELICLRDKSGEVHAVGFFVKDKNRVVFMVCGSTEFGKENHAMYLLVDRQINRYAGNVSVYDFFGSNLEGVAYFNSSFGATTETYCSVTIDRMPKLLKLFKK
jgi:hypothetical protein